MAEHTEQLTYVDDDKRIALYMRTDTKNDYWQARFRIRGQRKYKRMSSGFTDFEEAQRWALQKYRELDYRINEAGEAITSLSFKEVAKATKERCTACVTRTRHLRLLTRI